MRILKRLGKELLLPVRDFLYPPVCFTCDRPLEKCESLVCGECWQSITRVGASNPLLLAMERALRGEAQAECVQACYLFEEKGVLKEVLHLLKYRGMKSLGVRLGGDLGDRIRADGRFLPADYLVPVPLHKASLRERGYNQSRSIAAGVEHVTGIPLLEGVLLRTKYTRSQTQLERDARRENVRDAFLVPDRLSRNVREKTIILVDDVMTTGSTLTACARELVRAGTGRVLVAAAALAE